MPRYCRYHALISFQNHQKGSEFLLEHGNLHHHSNVLRKAPGSNFSLPQSGMFNFHTVVGISVANDMGGPTTKRGEQYSCCSHDSVEAVRHFEASGNAVGGPVLVSRNNSRPVGKLSLHEGEETVENVIIRLIFDNRRIFSSGI